MPTAAPATFAGLLESAVNDPGILSTAYRAFHDFSLGNMLLGYSQCLARGIQPGPMATFQRWHELGRHVRRGEKALVLCRPVTVKRAATSEDDADEAVFTRFVYTPRWFVLSQTDGEPVPEPPMPSWDKDRALAALRIQEVPFDMLDGNTLGVARARSIAINPTNPLPWKTRFHECAHILHGHTGDGVEQRDGEMTPRNLREVEAETVALLACAVLELPGVEFARGYIQNWWGKGNAIPERSAQKILKVADQILRAGRADETADEDRETETKNPADLSSQVTA